MNSRNPANHFIYATPPKPMFYTDANGKPAYRVVKDKLDDPIRVYRGAHVHKPGAGFASRSTPERRHVVRPS